MILPQTLLIVLLGYPGFIYGTLLLGIAGEWSMIGRPIIVRALVGLVPGNAKNGVLIGTAVQAFYVGLIVPGMSVPGDVNFASYIGVPLALVSNASPEYAMGISIPLSLLEVAAVYSIATFGAVLIYLQDRWVEGGRLKQAARIPIHSNTLQFIIHFIPISLACHLGVNYVPKMIVLILDQLDVILQMLSGILPAAGFALLIKFTLKKSIELLYVLAGFITMTVPKVPTAVITALAVFIAYLDYLRRVKQSQRRRKVRQFYQRKMYESVM